MAAHSDLLWTTLARQLRTTRHSCTGVGRQMPHRMYLAVLSSAREWHKQSPFYICGPSIGYLISTCRVFVGLVFVKHCCFIPLFVASRSKLGAHTLKSRTFFRRLLLSEYALPECPRTIAITWNRWEEGISRNPRHMCEKQRGNRGRITWPNL